MKSRWGVSLAGALAAGLAFGAAWAGEQVVSLDGGQFGPGSKNCLREDKRIVGGAKLFGSFGGGMAVYAFQIPGKAERLGAEVDFINAKKKKLSIYLYNYGAAADNNPARAKELDPKWWLWGTSEADHWVAPGEQEASDGTGKLDFVSAEGQARMLLFAPGGIPYLSDGLFFVGRVALVAKTAEASLTGFLASDVAWMEEGLVRAKGIGKPPPGMAPERGKILARRAAKAEAMRNLLIALGNARREDGTLFVQGTLQGVRTLEERAIEDGSVEVVVGIPVE